MKRNSKRRDKLFSLHPFCHWCGKEVHLYPHLRGRGRKRPLDEATLDHLRSRYNTERQIPSWDKEQTVLACWECNHRRGEEETKNMPPDELHNRSGRHGLTSAFSNVEDGS
jgi:5-methylcytosine-specific restriction endonuclease McrA